MRSIAFVFASLLALAIAAPAQAQPKLLHQERSLYRNIFVTQDGDELCMLFRYPRPAGRESCKLLHDPNRLIFDYTQMMLAGLYLNPNPKRRERRGSTHHHEQDWRYSTDIQTVPSSHLAVGENNSNS